MEFLTIFFVNFLLLIILAADLGHGPYLFAFLAGITAADMLGNFVLIGILSLLVNTLLGNRVLRLRSFRIPMGTAIILPLVSLEEFSQLFLQHRGFSFSDLHRRFRWHYVVRLPGGAAAEAEKAIIAQIIPRKF